MPAQGSKGLEFGARLHIYLAAFRLRVESDAGIQHFAMTDRRRATAAMCVCNAASRGRSRSLYSDRGRGRKGSEGPEIARHPPADLHELACSCLNPQGLKVKDTSYISFIYP